MGLRGTFVGFSQVRRTCRAEGRNMLRAGGVFGFVLDCRISRKSGVVLVYGMVLITVFYSWRVWVSGIVAFCEVL